MSASSHLHESARRRRESGLGGRVSAAAQSPAAAGDPALRESASGGQVKAAVPPRVNILGVGVHAIDMPTAVQAVRDALARPRTRAYICVTGVHGIIEAQRDPRLRQILNQSLLTTPDGMPTVWVGHLSGFRQMRRVFGPDFMTEVCQLTAKTGHTHFLYGGAPGVAGELKRNLESKFPGIQIVGTYTPPFRPLTSLEQQELADRIASVKPDIMWVGLSTPKQERFMAESVGSLDTKLMVGVGAAFDMHTGRVKDSPAWVKQAGLQWFHRLCQEPRRLWRRYLVIVPGFIGRVTLQLAGLVDYELPPSPTPEHCPIVNDTTIVTGEHAA